MFALDDLGACAFWLKHRKPERYDRVTWVKLSMLQAALTRAQANGDKRVTLEIGPDGMPVPVAERADQVVVYIPHNIREPLPPDAVPDPFHNGAAKASPRGADEAELKQRAEAEAAAARNCANADADGNDDEPGEDEE